MHAASLCLHFSSQRLLPTDPVQVADNENWNDTLYTHIAAFGPSAALFFISIIFVVRAGY